MNWIKEQSQTYPALSWSKSHIYLSRLSSSNVISINVFSFLFTVSTASFSFALLCLPVRRLQGKEKLSTSLHIHILCCAHGVSSLLFCFSRANPGWVQDNYPFHRDAVRVICYVRRSDNQHKSDSSTAYILAGTQHPTSMLTSPQWGMSFALQNTCALCL